MPGNFSPLSREAVREATEDQYNVHDTAPIGPGLMVIYESDPENVIRTYDPLVTRYGWYVASYDKRETGDVAVLMPIREVPE